jgi:hypothetical protein
VRHTTLFRVLIAIFLAVLVSALVAYRVSAAVLCEDRTSGFVDVWKDAHYQGGHHRYCGNDANFIGDKFDTSRPTNSWMYNGDVNDKVSSWKFRPGYGLTSFSFYRNTGYSGDWGANSETWADEAHDEGSLSAYHNDTFSSLRFNP